MESTTKKDQLSLSKQMFLALKQAETKLEMMERSRSEAIAIIGMGCKFPGSANTPERFWELLSNGQDSITEIPLERWDIDSYYDPNPDTPGKMYIRHAALVDQVDRFDSRFFGISEREAHSLDPQQRLILEVTWEALERAGINPQKLENTQTGVFLGIGQNDYANLGFRQGAEDISPYDATGNGFCFVAGRLSYFLGLQGPSLAIDTACSSSLVAIHEACQSLRQGESNLALAGGVHLILSPEVTIALSKLKALAPDGKCKTFDAAADGFGRGEGCGMVVLKRLSDALKDGDRISAVIRGSAVNNDGPSSGMTVPNKLAQEKVIRQALKAAKLEPLRVGYVETHGTGTSLGDPMEVRALARVFEEGREGENLLNIGSVKTNIGHLEAAAGIAGVIKVILQLEHQEIVPHLNFANPNPYIDWENIPVKVPTQLTPWLSSGEKRVAGVSSFGMSGTNAHIVLEEAPTEVRTQNSEVRSEESLERSLHLLTLSAKTEKALEDLVSNYQNYLETNPELKLADVCYTANTGRAQFNHRLGAIASSPTELIEKLLGWKTKEELVGVFSGKPNSESPKIAFLFTGQGSQYVNMGKQLYEKAPTFRQALEECDQILQAYLETSILEIIYPKDAQKSSILDQTAYTQPTIFALEYALFKLWESWGIKPSVVMGHSVGEYVAASVAGVFSLEDGLKLIAMRGKLMQQLPSGGEMVSVMASESQVTKAIKEYSSQVTIAAVNGPESIVISGESAAITNISSFFELEGVKTKQLQVSHAFHSPLMEPMLGEFEAVAKQVTYNEPKIPLISNVTGTEVGVEITKAEYWVGHVRQPVRFAQSMKTLEEQGYETFLEIGPKPILLGMGRQCVTEDIGEWLPSLRPGVDEWQQMLSTLGQLYIKGAKIDWSGYDSDYSRQKVALPTYPFQRERYWVETAEKQQKVHQNTENISEIPIIKLLTQGKTEALTQQLETVANFSPEKLKLLPEILDLLTKQYQEQLAAATVPIENWLYEVEWKNKSIFGKLLPQDFLIPPVEIHQKLTPTLTELVTQVDNETAASVQRSLDRLSIDYIVQALQSMGWSYKPTESFTFDVAAQKLGVVPTHRSLFHRLLQILTEEGILKSNNDREWEVAQTLPEVKPNEKSSSLQNKYPEDTPALTLLSRCGSKLSGVLQGAIDPVDVVFPQGDLKGASEFYEESILAKVMNTIVEKSITKAIEKLPKSRGIRLLEIGAGTGGTTGYILPHLNPEQTEYTFTDIGALFTANAQHKFQDYKFVKYETLDIEVDPKTQGFEAHKYDVIIAANVLHATTDMKQTLSNVRELLADGGMLVLSEATTKRIWLDLIFGLLEAWWKFRDYELRQDHPLLSREQWHQLLRETGFTEVVSMPEVEGMAETLSEQTVIVAQGSQRKLEPRNDASKNWLILADSKGVGQKLATLLRSEGEVCTLVFAGEKYEQITPGEFSINAHRPNDYSQLLDTLTTNLSSSVEVLHLWSLDACEVEKLTVETLKSASTLECSTILHLTQALLKAKLIPKVQLWLVTQGAQPIEGINSSMTGLAQSPVWGMGRVISLEHPDIWGGMVDLDPNSSRDESVALLRSEICDSDGEDHISFRDGQRYISRLMRSNQREKYQSLSFESNATYLITGGLGFLGLKLAEWMVDRGARNLVLTGRKGLPSREEWVNLSANNEEGNKIKIITSLENSGAKVRVCPVDVADSEQMSLVVESSNTPEKPLKGVVHAAGVVSLSLIEEEIEPDTIESMLRPKTVGTWILHELTKNLDMDFFVSFSSAGSVWGAKGQVVYDAANHFLDVFAYYRRSIGLPALSVNWGSLGQGGMVSQESLVQAMSKIGLNPLKPEQGYNALGRLMETNAVQTVVASVDWKIFKEVYQAKQYRPFLADIENISLGSEERSLPKQAEILKQLEAETESEPRYQLLVDYLQKEVAKVLGSKDFKLLSPEEGFFEMGMDSLMTVELRDKLQRSFNCSLPTTLAFEFPNIVTLANYISSKVLGWESNQTEQSQLSVTEEQKANQILEVENLSEEDVEDSILQELADLNTLLEEN